MMTPDYAARVDLWVRSDAALTGKVQFMREQLRRMSQPAAPPG